RGFEGFLMPLRLRVFVADHMHRLFSIMHQFLLFQSCYETTAHVDSIHQSSKKTSSLPCWSSCSSCGVWAVCTRHYVQMTTVKSLVCLPIADKQAATVVGDV